MTGTYTRRPIAARLAIILAFLFAASTAPSMALTVESEMSDRLRGELMQPVRELLREYGDSKDSFGQRNKRTTYSRSFAKVDEETYLGTVHVDTAEETSLTTERLQLTLKKEGNRWIVADKQVVDTFSVLRRGMGGNCYPFERFSFEREGLTVSGNNGWVCEQYFEGKVNFTAVGADDLRYEYEPPDYADDETIAMNAILERQRGKELIFDPRVFTFGGDSKTCEEFLDSSFKGLQRISMDQRTNEQAEIPSTLPSGLRSFISDFVEDREKDRAESAFAHFTYPDPPGQRYYDAVLEKNKDHKVGLSYNNWGGYEVTFWVYQDTTDLVAMNGTLFGYYTKETTENYSEFELEQRDDFDSRWYEVGTLSGAVDVALDDPEILKADLTFGINMKQDMDVLPFFIASVPDSGGDFDKRALFVNSIQHKGQELTWVKTGPISGLVVLPEPASAGDYVEISMNFATRAIKKTNHAASQMSRFGWMPFVRFGDFIDEFEMTIRTPAEYKVLGVGHKVSESSTGDVTTTVWRADSPVVFPTIIFGKYVTDTPKDYNATKLDGTVIPVTVHVDEVSMIQTGRGGDSAARGIRPSQLRPIAAQAAVAIDLFKELSGVDYPYGELNLVNDPAPALYGQAPSSLIYLGSMVFRGSGTLSSGSGAGGGTGTSKFLKSVTAHEVGHQWWGSRVSNANQRNYWFVETLAEYFSAIYLEQVFGRKEYEEQLAEWRRNVVDRDLMASVQNANTHWSGEFGGRTSLIYNKGPYMFHILRETFGDEKFFEYLKKFSMELTDKREIVSRDIQIASEKNLGGLDPNGNPYNVDLEWFFDQWLRGAGVPQYKLDYDMRRAENGEWIVEGTIHQRVVVGSSRGSEVVPGQSYRGVVDLSAMTKDGEFKRRVVVDGEATPFRVTLPEKPYEIALNKNGAMLAHDVKVNEPW